MTDQLSSNGRGATGGPEEVYIVLRRGREFPEDSWTLERALDDGAYEAARSAVGMAADDLIELVKESGLRGRGGAGFPTGMKWSFVPKDVFPKYIVVNHDEGEPGTFKDREIAERDPHGIIEGIIIAAWANQANKAFIYCRGEFALGARRMDRAIGEAYERGYLGKGIFGSDFDLDIVLHRGAGAYICGEESALLDSLEGFRGQPRLRPPFPAVKGLYGQPTVINNTETLATLPAIVKNGAAWFKQWGTEKSPGTKVMSVSGHVNKPANYEVPLGMSLADILELAGGMAGGKRVKAIIPGGASAPLLTTTDVAMDFDSLKEAGTMLGSGAIVFMDEDTCMVRNALLTAHFFEHESCGKCTPCREGTWWKVKILERLEHGEGREEDMDLLLDICDGMDGRSFCPLGDSSAMSIRSNIKLFLEEFERHVTLGRCPADDHEEMLVGAHVGRSSIGVGQGEAGVTPQPSAGIAVDGPPPAVEPRREVAAARAPDPVMPTKAPEPVAVASEPEAIAVATEPEPASVPEPVAAVSHPQPVTTKRAEDEMDHLFHRVQPPTHRTPEPLHQAEHAAPAQPEAVRSAPEPQPEAVRSEPEPQPEPVRRPEPQPEAVRSEPEPAAMTAAPPVVDAAPEDPVETPAAVAVEPESPEETEPQPEVATTQALRALRAPQSRIDEPEGT
ncbi:MAG: NADH-quinone oxidoreductase subunit [Actinomycetota bacterium]|nr:NADH-quinone oxidoreductase subunit [Actinomycetota bacterium]